MEVLGGGYLNGPAILSTNFHFVFTNTFICGIQLLVYVQGDCEGSIPLDRSLHFGMCHFQRFYCMVIICLERRIEWGI